MKTIIYAGIGLFAAASIYGAADYFRSAKKGTLKALYQEEQTVESAAVSTAVKTTTTASTADLKTDNKNSGTEANAAEKTITKANTKVKAKRPKRIRMEDFSRGRIEEELIMPVEEEKAAPEVKPSPVEKKDEVMVDEKPVKKSLMEGFSRAPLIPSKKRTVVTASTN